ncbi:MAG: type II CAAX prenyl endopeptidase Rce1 family protein [Lachnospiraceae bacterium]
MKEFWKKHIVFFCIVMITLAVFSNLILGFLQKSYATGYVSYYLIEAGFKAIIIVLLFVLMSKWKLFSNGKEKRILWGFLIGALNLLFILENLLPLTLVKPADIQVNVSLTVSICLAKISVGIMEELGVRGVLLTLMIEKWAGKKCSYIKAAVASSGLFAIMHFSWTIRELLYHGGISGENFLVNLSQVFFTFCFGMLAAGITLYSRSLLPMLIWHPLVSISAFLTQGLMSNVMLRYYMDKKLLTMERVFERYGIWPNVGNAYTIYSSIINIVILVAGVILVHMAKKHWGK